MSKTRTDREVRKRREKLGLSIELASGTAGISYSTWYGIESGGPSTSATMSTMRAVAKTLKCAIGDLV